MSNGREEEPAKSDWALLIDIYVVMCKVEHNFIGYGKLVL